MISFLRILLVAGDWVVFLHVPVFMLDGALWSIFGTSSDIFRYYRTPTKNPEALTIKCHAYKQLAGHSLCELPK